MAKPKAKCSKQIVSFKTKRGKKIEFSGHVGPACPARKKPSTRHLKAWKDALAKASPQCAKRFKGNKKQFRSCIRDAVKSVKG